MVELVEPQLKSQMFMIKSPILAKHAKHMLNSRLSWWNPEKKSWIPRFWPSNLRGSGDKSSGDSPVEKFSHHPPIEIVDLPIKNGDLPFF